MLNQVRGDKAWWKKGLWLIPTVFVVLFCKNKWQKNVRVIKDLCLTEGGRTIEVDPVFGKAFTVQIQDIQRATREDLQDVASD